MIANLDFYCAKHGGKVGREVYEGLEEDKNKAENHITKSLGVLQEEGIYAFFLYQRSEKDGGGRKVEEEAIDLFAEETIGLKLKEDALENALELCRYLDKLLLARNLLEQTLIYARYYIKGLKEEN